MFYKMNSIISVGFGLIGPLPESIGKLTNLEIL